MGDLPKYHSSFAVRMISGSNEICFETSVLPKMEVEAERVKLAIAFHITEYL